MFMPVLGLVSIRVNFLSQLPTVMSSATGRFADSLASSCFLRKAIKTWALALASDFELGVR
jgi:hypothetical protein